MLNVLVFLAAAGLVGAVGTAWVALIRRLLNGQAPVPWEPRRPARWGLLDVVLPILLLLLFSLLAASLVNKLFGIVPKTPAENLPVAYQSALVMAQACVSLATVFVSLLFLIPRCQVSLRELGFDRRTLWSDLKLGGAAFLVLAPPTYVLQVVLVQWFESKHPIVELIREHPDPLLIMASVFSAVIVAPLVEEYMFRGLLQGWLERFCWIGGDAISLVVGQFEPEPDCLSEDDGHHEQGVTPGRETEFSQPDSADSEQVFEPSPGHPYAPPTSTESELREMAADDDLRDRIGRHSPPRGALGFLPILVSSSIFAALHMSHGPDWIPLLLLAFGLGYLYRQTHRLLPCIVVHFLLNSVSMGMLLVGLLTP